MRTNGRNDSQKDNFEKLGEPRWPWPWEFGGSLAARWAIGSPLLRLESPSRRGRVAGLACGDATSRDSSVSNVPQDPFPRRAGPPNGSEDPGIPWGGTLSCT